MQRILLTVALLFAVSVAYAETELEGRWVFHGLSDSGRRVPLFIAEFAEAGKQVKLISTSAPFDLELQNATRQGSQVIVEILADGRKLTLTGTIAHQVIKGRATGETLNGLAFVAEPTTLGELKKPVAPSPDEIEAFRAAESNPSPENRISSLKEFVDKHPGTALRTAALLAIVQAAIESNLSEEELLQAIEQAVESAPDKATVSNDLAYTLAEEGKLLQKAEELARAAASEVVPGTVAEANFLDTLGWVFHKQGDQEQAIATLRRALMIAPRQADIALHLAAILEDQGDTDEAIRVYLQAHVATINRTARVKAQQLFRQKNGSLEGFHELLDQAYANHGPLFDAGRYHGTHSGPAVLAELFTGAQCGPCQAADYGFDALLEHYPSQVLTVLEHHLHVPGPDPMTNPDTAARARLYNIRSTPVAVFGGTERVPGGGPIARAEVAFAHYREAVTSLLAEKSKIQLELTVQRESDDITAKATVRLPAGESSAEPAKPHLFLVLVEKTVHYTGQNGVHLHRHVVRKFINGTDGDEVSSPEFEFQASTSVAEVEDRQRQYLEKLKQEWEVAFDQAPIAINREDLAVVAFVQDLQTGRVLGATTTDVK
jgi:tetratricopeptide (TPR) repeat protein